MGAEKIVKRLLEYDPFILLLALLIITFCFFGVVLA
jgi:hypothetical protein